MSVGWDHDTPPGIQAALEALVDPLTRGDPTLAQPVVVPGPMQERVARIGHVPDVDPGACVVSRPDQVEIALRHESPAVAQPGALARVLHTDRRPDFVLPVRQVGETGSRRVPDVHRQTVQRADVGDLVAADKELPQVDGVAQAGQVRHPHAAPDPREVSAAMSATVIGSPAALRSAASMRPPQAIVGDGDVRGTHHRGQPRQQCPCNQCARDRLRHGSA